MGHIYLLVILLFSILGSAAHASHNCARFFFLNPPDEIKNLTSLELERLRGIRRYNSKLTDQNRAVEIRRALRSDHQRIVPLKKVTGVMRAHREVPVIVGTPLETWQVLAKTRILKLHGLTSAEIRKVLNLALAGSDVIRVENMKVFFSGTSFGKDIQRFSQKTKTSFQGQAVFRMSKKNAKYSALSKGDYYYLDNLHKDHMEVFNSNGNFKHVLNLDGTINIDKTNKARGRKIKVR